MRPGQKEVSEEPVFVSSSQSFISEAVLALPLGSLTNRVEVRGPWPRTGILPRPPGAQLHLSFQAFFILHRVQHHILRRGKEEEGDGAGGQGQYPQGPVLPVPGGPHHCAD